MKKYYSRIILTFFVVFSVILVIPQRVNAEEKKKILFISAHNTTFLNFSDQLEGIKLGFDGNVEIHIEYLDSHNGLLKNRDESFYTLLKYTLDAYNDFDAIVLADDEALEFGIKYRNDLFKDIPIAFLGVNDEENIKKALSYELVSGVREVDAIEDNINLIAKLHKGVNNITIINNVDGEDIQDAYEKSVRKYPDIKINTLITSDMKFEEFVNKVNEFDEDDAVVMLYPYDFKDGFSLKSNDTILLLNKIIKSPIYSIVTYGVGQGFVGGNVVSHTEQGKKTAEIINGMLEGKDPKSLYIGDDSTNKYIFDYKKLKEFRISTRLLPNDSIILNEPATILKEYKMVIFSVGVVFISLIIIIVVLVKYSVKITKNERELIKAKREAEEANKAKGNFISNINHELRTPVTVIMAANKLLKLKLSDYKSRELNGNLDVINQNCYRLIRLINNIIDVAKVDSGFQELKLKNRNIVELFEMIVLSVVPYAKEKNIEIVFDTTDEEQIMAVDANKIERIVLNLLSNAIKFSKEGGLIFVDVIVEEEQVKFSVADNGIGIDSEHLEKIFNKFTQVDDTFTRENEGSGIGLSLVKSFVEMHGGVVKVESGLGYGSRFTVEFPINVLEEEEEEEFKFIEDDGVVIRTKVEFSDIYF